MITIGRSEAEPAEPARRFLVFEETLTVAALLECANENTLGPREGRLLRANNTVAPAQHVL